MSKTHPGTYTPRPEEIKSFKNWELRTHPCVVDLWLCVSARRCHHCGGMKVKKSSTARVSLYMALCGGCAQHAAASICWTILLSTPLLRWEVKLLHTLLRHHHSSSSESVRLCAGRAKA